jgi:hypothetical protein
MPGLSIADLVSVDVVLQPTATPVENFGALLLLDASDTIDTDERIRKFTSLTSVGTDFGTDSDAYDAATFFFGQNPQPSDLYIGKWAKTGTAGLLYGGALTTAQQALTNFTSVDDGALDITVDGTAKTLTDLDFTSVTNLNGVATVLTTALSGATVTWDAANSRFVVKSPTTGTASKIGFGAAGESGTDVSLLINLTSATKAKAVDGIAAESLLDAVEILAAKSNEWYGLAVAVPSVEDSDIVDVAKYVEAASPRRFLSATTQDVNALDPDSTTDLAAQLQALKLTHTACQYSSSSPYAAVSLFARQASVDFTAQSSVISLMYKQEPLVSAETLTETQAQALKDKNCNVFVNYSNNVAFIQHGTVASGLYIDSVVGADFLQNQAMVDVFNLLYTSTTKLSQTDAGVNQLTTTLEATMDKAVNNGLLAPGVWDGPDVGPLKSGQVLSKGYFIFCSPISSQSAADRAARKSPTIQIAAHLGGAIHTAKVIIQVAS